MEVSLSRRMNRKKEKYGYSRKDRLRINPENQTGKAELRRSALHRVMKGS